MPRTKQTLFLRYSEAVITGNPLELGILIRQHYLDSSVANHESGFNFEAIRYLCGGDASCRTQVSSFAAYVLSIEFQQLVAGFDGLYRAAMDSALYAEFMPEAAVVARMSSSRPTGRSLEETTSVL